MGTLPTQLTLERVHLKNARLHHAQRRGHRHTQIHREHVRNAQRMHQRQRLAEHDGGQGPLLPLLRLVLRVQEVIRQFGHSDRPEYLEGGTDPQETATPDGALSETLRLLHTCAGPF